MFYFVIFKFSLDVEETQSKDILIKKFTFDLYYMTIPQDQKSLSRELHMAQKLKAFYLFI